jgi:hypothetical protein
MPPRLSVILCTYNPRTDYLARVIEALSRQTLAQEKWEFVVIDNKSPAPVAGTIDLAWHSSARVVREETPGLIHARLRGCAETSADLVVYVDDDNILAPDYLATALRLSEEMLFIGVWSASIRGEFETPPEPWMRPYLPYLALSDFTSDRWANHPEGRTLPIGAGMVVRREVMHAYRETVREDPSRLGLDRKGKSLLAGGDTDIGLASCAIGLGCAYMTTLRVTHLIPACRLTPNYLARLVTDVTASHHWIEFRRGGRRPGLYARIKLRIKVALGILLGARHSFHFEATLARGLLKATTLDPAGGRQSHKL